MAGLESGRLDALLVSHLPNIRYLTGFTGSNALLVLSARSATLHTDPRYDLQASEQCDCAVSIATGALQSAAVKEIRRRRFRHVGVEGERISYQAGIELRAALGGRVRVKTPAGLVEAQRAVKSSGEVEAIRRSVCLNSIAYERALKRYRPAMTERELAARIGFEMRKLGAEGEAFPTIVASGGHSALPHAEPRDVAIGTGRLLLVDMGASVGGYASDMTRMAHVGEPGKRARKLHAAVLEAQLAALAAVRPGVEAGEIDKAARQVLSRLGYGEQFRHSTGHGLGLEIHEMPRLGAGSKVRLEAGMTITIEPGAYVPGFGGVRIEDTVLVTPGGCEVLTPTSKEFVVLPA